MAKEILIADSDKADQKAFKKIFETTDYNVVFSESGEQALLRLKLFKPDLIIAGASLKEKSGLEVCKAVKADPESKHIPVVLLSNVFKGLSEEDRKRVRADGVINTPFQEDEILNLVDRLMDEEETKGKKGGIIGREMERKSAADMMKSSPPKEDELLLDELAESGDEEIVDLVDVVEEPELKMSIDDFVPQQKEATFTEITPLESWEKMMEGEKPADGRFKFAPDEREKSAKGMALKLGEELTLGGEAFDKDLLDKIELEEILQKVEQLTPSVEKEFFPDQVKKAPAAAPPKIEEPIEKFAGLAEFEAALRRGVGTEIPDETTPAFFAEKEKKEAAPEVVPAQIALEEELKTVETEEFPEVLLEEVEEEELKEIEVEELKEERMEILEEEELPELEEEEIRVIEEPEEERLELFKELLEAPEVSKEEVRVFDEPKEERLELFEELLEAPEVSKEEVRVFDKPKEERLELFEELLEAPEVTREEVRPFEKPKEERLELFEELLEAPEITREEVRPFEKPKEERLELFEELLEAPEVTREEVRPFEKPGEERVELFREAAAPEVKAPEVTAPSVQREEMIPRLRVVERQLEEVISKGAREMMEGFITKLVPEMTQNIMNLTIDRIERMVKEIVPELAEKMIQEEIKRLQKEERD